MLIFWAFSCLGSSERRATAADDIDVNGENLGIESTTEDGGCSPGGNGLEATWM